MAARPNALRTLAYGKRLAENQISRLRDMIDMAEATLQSNKTLTADDVEGYRACIVAGKSQLKQFTNVFSVDLPSVNLQTKRKRGRPSEEELAALAASRQKPQARVKPVAAPAPTEGQRRRGRPPKNAAAPAAEVKAVVQDAPKRRGRPPKNAAAPIIATPPAAVAAETPKRRGRPPKNAQAQAPVAVTQDAPPVKRRGRPPKNAQAEVTTQGVQPQATKRQKPVAAAPVSVVTPEVPAKRRGRPPKNPQNAQPVQPTAVQQPPADAPKRRGRPPKVKAESADVSSGASDDSALYEYPSVEAEAPKKRGRPPKAQSVSADSVPVVNTAPISDALPAGVVKRGPGRPKGSKNKPKVLNGANATA